MVLGQPRTMTSLSVHRHNLFRLNRYATQYPSLGALCGAPREGYLRVSINKQTNTQASYREPGEFSVGGVQRASDESAPFLKPNQPYILSLNGLRKNLFELFLNYSSKRKAKMKNSGTAQERLNYTMWLSSHPAIVQVRQALQDLWSKTDEEAKRYTRLNLPAQPILDRCNKETKSLLARQAVLSHQLKDNFPIGAYLCNRYSSPF